MKLRYKILSIGLILSNIISASPFAFAAPATASVALNVRSGPGTNYPVVDTLEAGEQVNTSKCASGWCFIDQSGPNGWVFEKYLRTGGPQRPDPIFQNLTSGLAKPGFTWPFPLAPKASPSTRPASQPFVFPQVPAQALQFPWPIRPAPLPFTLPGEGETKGAAAAPPSPYQVCFFAGENFTAQSKCVTSGRSFSRLGPAWNNRISSLQIKPGTRVTLCQRPDFNSPCLSFNANVPVLPPQLNNKVTSGRVF